MGQLLLVRHGQASWDGDDYDVLSPLGWEQSRMLGQAFAGRALVPELVVQGGMRRHRETATGVSEAAGWDVATPVNDPGWNELDHVGVLAAQRTPAFAGPEPTPACSPTSSPGTDRSSRVTYAPTCSSACRTT